MDSKIFKGVIASYVLIICNILSVLLYTPFLIRSLGKSDYAVYTVVYAFLNYFVIDFGIGQSLAKFLTDTKYRESIKYTAQQILGVIFKVYILIAIILGIVFVALYPYLDVIFSGFTTEEMVRLRGVYAVAAGYTIVSFVFMPLEGIFTANELFAELKTFIMAKKLSTILLTVVVLWLDMGLMWVMVVGAVSDCMVILGELLFLNRKGLLHISWGYWNGKLLREILTFSLWIALVGLSQQFIIPITPTILGHFSNSEQVALFSVAMTLEQYAYTFSGAIRGMLLPKISKLAGSNNYELINDYQIKVGRIQLYVIGLILSASYVFGREFITLWVGESYEESFLLYVLISCSDIVTVTLEVGFMLLMVDNLVKYRSCVYITGAIVCSVLSLTLADRYGALGSATAIFMELWIFNVVFTVLVFSKKSKVRMKDFFKECHLKILPMIIVYSLAWLAIECLFAVHSWLLLILKGILYVVFFSLCAWKFCFSTYEKCMFMKIMKMVGIVMRGRKV